METAKLYQTAGVNPLAGCLPTLVTIPVFIGLYRRAAAAAGAAAAAAAAASHPPHPTPHPPLPHYQHCPVHPWPPAASCRRQRPTHPPHPSFPPTPLPCRALSNVADEGLLTEGFFWIPSLAGPTKLNVGS